MVPRLQLFREPAIDVVYECRSCGATVEDANATCPYCSTNSIARYELR